MTEFEKEIHEYSTDDLELIISTQQDLYSKQEMAIIEQELSNRRLEEEKAKIPSGIKCSKCDMVNSLENDICDYCKCKINKSEQFYVLANSSNDENYSEDEAENYYNENVPCCPICQSTDLSKISNAKKVGKIALFGIFGAGDIGKTWKCNNCESRF